MSSAPLQYRGITGHWTDVLNGYAQPDSTTSALGGEPNERGEIGPSFIITRRTGLEDAPVTYRTFCDNEDSCIAVVMKAGGGTHT